MPLLAFLELLQTGGPAKPSDSDMPANPMEEMPMSVLGILLHFGRAVIQAHNNAKVRNLMDATPPEGRKGVGLQDPADTLEKGRSDRSVRRRGR